MQLVINISLLPFGYVYFKKLSKKKWYTCKIVQTVSIDVNIMFAVNYVLVTFIYIYIYNPLPMHLKSHWTNLVHVWCRSFIPHIWENRSLVAINLFLQFSIKIFNFLNPVVRLIYIPLPLLLLVQNHLPLVK